MKNKSNSKIKEIEQEIPKEVELKKLSNWEKLIDQQIAPKLIDLYQNRLIRQEAPIAKSTLWGFFIIVGIILIGTFLLVLKDKLDSASVTLIIGTILGYFLSTAKLFIKREDA